MPRVKWKTIGLDLTWGKSTPPSSELKTTSIEAPKEKFLGLLGGLLELAKPGLSNEKWVSTKVLEANREWVYRNNDVIAMEVSKMCFELYRVSIKGGEIVYDEVESHPLLNLLDKPNPEETKSEALYILQSHRKLAGDAFWLKVMNGKTVKALRHLQPDKIELVLQQPSNDDPTVVVGYRYKDVIDGKQINILYSPDEIIHIKKPNPRNQFRGLGVVEALAETIDVDNLTNQTTANFFKKGAITNFVLSTDQKIQDDQLKRLRAELRQDYGGANNAYKTMILGGGLKPEKIGFSNKDMEFLDQLAWYRDKIMCGFGNTLAVLGLLDDVNRATHESATLEWKRTTVKPDMDAIVNALNEYLVPQFGADLVLGYTDPIPEDRSSKVDEAKGLYPIGVMTLNEAREALGYDSLDGGDAYFMPNTGMLQPIEGMEDSDDDAEEEDEEIDAEGDETENPGAEDD